MGEWVRDEPVKADDTRSLSLFDKFTQFRVPVFQRPYSWTRAECHELLGDIIGLAERKTSSTHFIGSVVYVQDGLGSASNGTAYRLIDGQQRLTTLLLLLAALRQRARDLGPGHERLEHLTRHYMLNDQGSGEMRYKLRLTDADHPTLRALLDETAFPLEPSTRLRENFEYLRDHLEPEDQPERIFDALTRLLVVEVILDPHNDNPQLIFESLNSKGLSLTQADLVRNFVLLDRAEDDQRHLYDLHWRPIEQAFRDASSDTFDRFLRDYLSLKRPGKPVRLDIVYRAFKRFVQDQGDRSALDSILADLHRLSGLYRALKDEDGFGDAPKAGAALRSLRALRVDAAQPLLLQVADDWQRGRISQDGFAQVVRLVESYLLRRTVCKLGSAGVNQLFPELARDLARLDSSADYVLACEQQMVYWPASTRFPTDEEFGRALQTTDLYHRQANLDSAVLLGLENRNHKEPVLHGDFTIEHVLPQDPNLLGEWRKMLGENWKEIQEKYLHTLGNLTLTGYNSELGNRPFNEKQTMKGGFKDSHLWLNRDLTELSAWTPVEIEARAEKLAKRAIETWARPIPRPEFAPVREHFERLLTSDDLRAFYTKFKNGLLTLIPGLRTTDWPRCITFRIKLECLCSVRLDPNDADALRLWFPIKAEAARELLPETALHLRPHGKGILCRVTAQASLEDITLLSQAAAQKLEGAKA